MNRARWPTMDEVEVSGEAGARHHLAGLAGGLAIVDGAAGGSWGVELNYSWRGVQLHDRGLRTAHLWSPDCREGLRGGGRGEVGPDPRTPPSSCPWRAAPSRGGAAHREAGGSGEEGARSVRSGKDQSETRGGSTPGTLTAGWRRRRQGEEFV